jgi:hypothetical protein
LAFLISHVGTEALGAAFAELRWWQFPLVCLPYLPIAVVDTLGWRYAFARDHVPFHRLLGARLAGESLNVVTAAASVGGEAVKAWLINRDVPYERSVPAGIIAKTTITVAQALFLLVGIAVAWLVLPMDSSVVRSMLGLLGLEAVAVGGFVLVQVTGLVHRGGKLLAWLGVTTDASYAARLDGALRGFYLQNWRRLALSLGFHFCGWLLGGVETYLMLVVLGVPVPFLTAIVIEAFGSAVRFATFLIPASIGALEGANVAAFAALGFTGGAGLAFSLVRRGRQAAWILVGFGTLIAMRSTARLGRPARSPVSSPGG